MKLLHVISSLNPEGGGPPEGLRQFARTVPRLGPHSIEVATMDAPGAPWIGDFPATVHALGPSYLNYRYAPRFGPWLADHAPQYDAVIVNGLWQYHSFATWRQMRRLRRPYYVFTHGMLDPWFRRRYPVKHLKKLLYWPWAEYRVLRDASGVLFTTEEEQRLAAQSFGLYRSRPITVGYGIEPPAGRASWEVQAFLRRFPMLAGKRMLLYLSRIHPKKGCDLLIEAFARVAALDPALMLMMAGPDALGYGERLRALAGRLGVADRILWPGMLKGELKWGALRSAEAFVLISHQENFGIAVVEALACGTPVIISNQVNIWREVLDDDAGIVCVDNREDAARALRAWAGMASPRRDELAERARQCFATRFHIEAAARRLLEVVGSAPAAV